MNDALHVDLAGVRLCSPVILAAGTAGTLDEAADVIDLSRVGAVVTKSITPEPRDGNPAWRVAPVKSGMINAIGLANPGLDGFMTDWAPRIPGVPCPVIGSIAGGSVDDYVRVAEAFDGIDAMPAVELNVSCPNTHNGSEFGSDPDLLAEVVAAVRPALTRTKLFVKLPPAAVPAERAIVSLTRAAVFPGGGSAVGGGADGLSIANTTPALAIDVETRRPRLGNGPGGLSGPAVHQIAVKLVRDAYAGLCREAGVPIIGIGGVLKWDDAAEFALAGASAVQVGTGTFVNPRSPVGINRGLWRWLKRSGVPRFADAVGTAEVV